MKRTRTLNLLVELAEREHQSTQGQLGHARRQLNQAVDTEEMLRRYKDEQAKDQRLHAGQLARGQDLLLRRGFAEKLDLAIGQQGGVVARHSLQTDQAQVQVNAAAVRLMSIERLVSLRQERQRQKQLKADQRQTDERASHIAIRRKKT